MTNRVKGFALVGLLLPSLAFTFGGWAVVTVDAVPEYAEAGKPVQIAYTVRQHGVSLLSGLTGYVNATSGELTTAVSSKAGETVGKYVATVTFPSAGQWEVHIGSGFMQAGSDIVQLTVVARGTPAPAAMSAATRGRQLFIAKGCVTCHSHQLTAGYQSINAGPNLTEPKFMSTYLTRFLADPTIKTDWKTDARMPNLELKPTEISSLIAFLNRESKPASK